jgi:hypothetical protein
MNPIPLGTFIMPLGKVGAVGMTNGERYYWMVGHDGAVTMTPAMVVEPMYLEQYASPQGEKP